MANSTWDDSMYVQVYMLARNGFTDTSIAKALGVVPKTFTDWKKNNEALRKSLEKGRSSDEGKKLTSTFQDYIYKQLPPKLKKLWKKIKKCKSSNQIEKMEALLKEKGTVARQYLFVHAFVTYNFNMSAACRSVNISRKTVREWVKKDPDFGELLDEMEGYKDDFFEDAFIKLVKEGDPKAIIAAAKMRLHKKGYGEKTTKNVNVNVNKVTENKISLDQLDLPIEVRQQMLEQYRQKQRLLSDGNTQDAEIISVKKGSHS